MPTPRRRFGFIGTRVGRRTLAAFLLAALLPAVAVAYVGQWQVRAAIVDQARAALLRLARSSTSVLSDRLASLASDASMHAYGVVGAPIDADDAPDAYRHLLDGGVLIDVDSADAPLRLRRRVSGGEMHWSSSAIDLWGALDQLFVPARSGYCVFELRTWRRLHCSPGFADTVSVQALRVLAATQRDGTTQLTPTWVVASHDLFLRTAFAAEPWRMVAVESRSVVLAATANSATTLVLLVLVASPTALALGHVQVRRSTQPLESLRHATQEVMAGNFETRVPITSNDEYGEVSVAFNAMTEVVGRQVMLMRGLDAVDEVALRTRRSDAIVEEALERLHQARPGDSITITTLDGDDDDGVSIVHADGRSPAVRRSRGRLRDEDRDTLLASVSSAQSMILPLQHDKELLGVIECRGSTESATSDDEVSATRRMADRVALGLANVRFLTQLEALTAGTLLAFARAIDANSKWTAGHSERVTLLSVRLGQLIGLSAADLERLQRGGLMHDIGKIGIPAPILDKAERLTAEEFDIIKRHPEIGEQILKVVPAFRDILCIVRSHHERFDGRGYPDGLAGEAIPFLARVVAVADVYDAMVSDRPYRRGLAPKDVVGIITRDAMTHFDPVVVDALRQLEQLGALDDMLGLVQHGDGASDFIMGPPALHANAG